jgi:pilus assembly protein CpaC
MFQVGNANSAFFGVLDALRQDSLAKILAEPNLVTISGRPAHFHVGGEFLYQINGGITGPSVESKDYGTTIDVVPIVMGNGRIRLEVRPSVSEIDESFSVGGIPALKIREVETGVEMKAGQTLAIAGLVQNLVDSQNSGLPWVSEVPYAGVLFRHVQEQINEVETLIIVTPELVEAMDASQVPPCGPGMDSASPNDWELFFKGHLEVPVCGPPGAVNACMLGSQPTAPPPAGSPAPAAGNAAPLPAPLPPSAPNATAAAGPYNSYTSSQATNSPPLRPEGHSEEPAFIGPIGYDAVN